MNLGICWKADGQALSLELFGGHSLFFLINFILFLNFT